MATNKRFTVRYRRKRNARTDYRKRLRLLLSRKPRLVVRKKIDSVIAQIVLYENKGDRILASAYSTELKKLGWKYATSNLPSAYLTGLLIAKKAKGKNVDFCILDIGLEISVKGSSIYALLKGALDAGLKIPHNENILPDEKRVSGQHIRDYAQKIKNTEHYKKQFSNYLKNNINPEDIAKEFERIKTKILEK